MGVFKKCAAVLVAGACAVGALQATFQPQAIVLRGETRANASILLGQHHLLYAFAPGALLVDRSDAAKARAIVAQLAPPQLRLDDGDRPAALVAALCRVPGIARVAVAPGEQGVVVMLELLPGQALAAEHHPTVLNLVRAEHVFQPGEIKVVDPEGRDLIPAQAPARAENQRERVMRELTQSLADSLLGPGKSRVSYRLQETLTQRMRTLYPVSIKDRRPVHKIEIAVAPSLSMAARTQLERYLEHELRLQLQSGDSITFKHLPLAALPLAEPQIRALREQLTRPAGQPWSYSQKMALAAILPGLICWAILGADLIRKHRFRG